MGSLYSYIEKDGKQIYGSYIPKKDRAFYIIDELPKCCKTCGRYADDIFTAFQCAFFNIDVDWWHCCNFYELDPDVRNKHKFWLDKSSEEKK